MAGLGIRPAPEIRRVGLPADIQISNPWIYKDYEWATWIETMNENATPKMKSCLDKTTSHMPQLDTLRAFAVVEVAYVHWIPEEYRYWLPFSMGVPLFFVLSGFLISSI